MARVAMQQTDFVRVDRWRLGRLELAKLIGGRRVAGQPSDHPMNWLVDNSLTWNRLLASALGERQPRKLVFQGRLNGREVRPWLPTGIASKPSGSIPSKETQLVQGPQRCNWLDDLQLFSPVKAIETKIECFPKTWRWPALDG